MAGLSNGCADFNQFEPYIAVRHPELLQDHKFFIEEEDIAWYRTGQISVGLGMHCSGLR